MLLKNFCRALTTLLLALQVQAETSQLELAFPFSEHMVLQRERPAPVLGWGEPGAYIKVFVAGVSKRTKDGLEKRIQQNRYLSGSVPFITIHPKRARPAYRLEM